MSSYLPQNEIIYPQLCIHFYFFQALIFGDESSSALFELSLEELPDLQVVNSASGFNQSIRDAPGPVSVLQREDWEVMGARSLSEAIQHLSGLYVGKNKYRTIQESSCY